MSGIKRAFGNSDSESDSDSSPAQSSLKRPSKKSNKIQYLTGFSSSSSSSSSKNHEPPRIIPSKSNANWMEERKKALGLTDYARKNLGGLVTMSGADGNGNKSSVVPQNQRDNGNSNADTLPMEQKKGLTIRKKQGQLSGGDQQGNGERIRSREEEEEELNNLMNQASSSSYLDSRDETPPKDQLMKESTPEAEELDEEELARKALLAGDVPTNNSSNSNAQRIILTEEEIFKQDLDYKPSEPTLEDYNRVPVEGFGMALLRGMGWKESDKEKNKVDLPKKRSNLLGLGAKDRADIGGDEKKGKLGKLTNGGTNGKKATRADDSRSYKPLIRRGNGGIGSSTSNAEPDVSSSYTSPRNGKGPSSSPPSPRSSNHRNSSKSDVNREERNGHSKGKEKERSGGKERDRERSRSPRSDRRYDRRESRRDRDHDRDRDKHRERERDRDRDRDRHRDRRTDQTRDERRHEDRDRDRKKDSRDRERRAEKEKR